ncbi:MAG TPA: hypothetical protein VGQ17_14875 [Gemmatimonadales bacterium]|jgi:hypothetical protein|nr:hypothetical protein [Gemmatimonadales bacterium]
MAPSNLERLVKAKLLDPDRLSTAHKTRLNKLTRAEVTTLIRVRGKLKFKGKLHRPRGKVEAFTFI